MQESFAATRTSSKTISDLQNSYTVLSWMFNLPKMARSVPSPIATSPFPFLSFKSVYIDTSWHMFSDAPDWTNYLQINYSVFSKYLRQTRSATCSIHDCLAWMPFYSSNWHCSDYWNTLLWCAPSCFIGKYSFHNQTWLSEMITPTSQQNLLQCHILSLLDWKQAVWIISRLFSRTDDPGGQRELAAQTATANMYTLRSSYCAEHWFKLVQ